MQSLEANRVLAVVDDALDSLRLCSYVTNEILETAEQLRDPLSEDMVKDLVRHRTLIQNSKAHIGSDLVVASTAKVLRMLKSAAAGSGLQSLNSDRSPAMLQVINFMERLRSQLSRRLSSTVEEDASNQEYYEEVRAREEKAVAEKVQLEQKLKLQRVELARRMNTVQSSEDSARAEVQAVSNATSQAQAGIVEETAAARQTDMESYQGDHENLSKELDAARARLLALQAEHKAAEEALRKNKRRAAQDVESAIAEYDADVGAKDKELQAAQAAQQETLRQMEELNKQAAEMAAARQAAEAEEARIAQEKLQAALKFIRQRRAAYVIQAAWKAFKAKKAAEAKKKKKAEAKAKKK